ncbi:hypothetical protein PFLU4_05640 [Pseudomonas fluorescens]|nr:hypothetical protein PFLU4_05640 [Pseudomonas fluorescens]
MIKLTRKDEPEVLRINKVRWLAELRAAIDKYGSYKNIPISEKNSLTASYRHQDIKAALIESSYGKCAFCECVPAEGGNVEVEHFKPKSIYPDLTFEWTNFLPSCRKCNGTKLFHDTGLEPIINPYDDDPSLVFYFDELQLKVLESTDASIGLKTIEVCGLNTVRLWRPRADILVSLYCFASSLEEALTNFKEAETEGKRVSRFRKISEAVDQIELLTKEKEKYSFFCLSFLKKCNAYIEAKSILDEGL